MADHGKPKVGYKRPPQHTQFKSGQSGNPKGRPRKVQSTPGISSLDAFDEKLRSIVERNVTVTEGGRSISISVLDAVLLAEVKTAMSGNAMAQRNVRTYAAEIAQRDAQRAAEEEKITQFLLKRQLAWKEERRKIWDAAEALDEEPAEPWPHPDDMFINHETGHTRIRGPRSPQCMPRYEFMRAHRDYLFVWTQLQRREHGNDSRWYNAAGVMYASAEGMLPKRWQILSEYISHAMPYMTMPIRQIRKEVDRLEGIMLEAEATAEFGPSSDEYHAMMDLEMRPTMNLLGFQSSREMEASVQGYRSKRSITLAPPPNG